MVEEVKTQGDPHRGEMIFRRKDLTCLNCHAIGGAGGRVGPDMSSLGGSAQVDYLIESILEPNKKVKENYHTVVVATIDGEILSGVKLRQTDTDLILRNVDDKEISIPLEDIDEQKNGSSIMPQGLANKLTRQELIDLVRFMSELGKTENYSVGTSPVARRWQALEKNDPTIHAIRRTSFATVVTDNPAFVWSPVYSTVSGELLLEGLPDMTLVHGQDRNAPGYAFVRTEISVTSGGECQIELNDVAGARLWIDSEAVKIDNVIKLNLEPGEHKLTFALDLNERKLPLKVLVKASEGSSAQVKPILGK